MPTEQEIRHALQVVCSYRKQLKDEAKMKKEAKKNAKKSSVYVHYY